MSVPELLSECYRVSLRDTAPFGDEYIGQLRTVVHGERLIVAKYDGEGDGQTVEVYCFALPSRGYHLEVLPGPDSMGEQQPGYNIQTGSGMGELAATLAKAIAEGMIGFKAGSAA